MPQGLELGPILYVLFINDLPDKIAAQIKRFADVSKIMGIIRSEENEVELQKDIDKAVEWSYKWFLPLNLEKCKVMHVGKKDKKSKREYRMADTEGLYHELEITC